ncbi:carboxymuconolactone decarboxylase family protein [Cellulosimicrobium sp. E-16]|uniref:carboxymuconolactone decarboxylase family protein n=1 Tax=Cellulosimicrobium sp. E-16 TaxID=3404049 RepID=UPI003CF09BC7
MTTTTTTAIPADVPADTPVAVPARFDVEALMPDFYAAVAAVDKAAVAEAERAGISPVLADLVRLRASQLNGCAYCVDLHTRTARRAGADEQLLQAVAVWRESGFFTARERAALELTESVTRLSETHVPDDVARVALDALGEQGTAAVLALLVSINAWNALAVASRTWAPERKTR